MKNNDFLTPKQRNIIQFIKNNKKRPKNGSKDSNYLSRYLYRRKNSLFTKIALKVMKDSKIPFRNKTSIYINKSLVLDFVLSEKRKPSRYSLVQEERRLWNVMAAYTTKTHTLYDEEFSKHLNSTLKSLGFKFKKSPNYWTIDNLKKEMSKYSDYHQAIKNPSIQRAAHRKGLKKENFVFTSKGVRIIK